MMNVSRDEKSFLEEGYENTNGENDVFDKVVVTKKNLNLNFFNWAK